MKRDVDATDQRRRIDIQMKMVFLECFDSS